MLFSLGIEISLFSEDAFGNGCAQA